MTSEKQLAGPSLGDQVTRLYDIIGGYHATNLIEIARELGVWSVITANPGMTSAQLSGQLQTDPFYTDVLCRTAFSFDLLDREGDGWRMAPHFDQILGNPDSTFYLAGAARVHMLLGNDYRDYVQHFHAGTKRTFQQHDETFMAEIADALRSLPRIFLDFVLPQLPDVAKRFESGARVLDVGCGGGWALVQIAERFPNVTCIGVDVEPHSVELANQLIAERGLTGRCEARVLNASTMSEESSFDIATSFLVIHEIDPMVKALAFASIARSLAPGGMFVIFDEAYPDNDADLCTMPKRFAALAQWYELTWGNRVNTRSELVELCENAGLEVAQETTFSRFHIMIAAKP
jgi:SAM-dependent methyltransferase